MESCATTAHGPEGVYLGRYPLKHLVRREKVRGEERKEARMENAVRHPPLRGT